MSSEPVISARGLGKAYRIYRRPEDRLKELVLRRRYHEDFWAVRDVDLSVARGELVALVDAVDRLDVGSAEAAGVAVVARIGVALAAGSTPGMAVAII